MGYMVSSWKWDQSKYWLTYSCSSKFWYINININKNIRTKNSDISFGVSQANYCPLVHNLNSVNFILMVVIDCISKCVKPINENVLQSLQEWESGSMMFINLSIVYIEVTISKVTSIYNENEWRGICANLSRAFSAFSSSFCPNIFGQILCCGIYPLWILK